MFFCDFVIFMFVFKFVIPVWFDGFGVRWTGECRPVPASDGELLGYPTGIFDILFRIQGVPRSLFTSAAAISELSVVQE
jgi:hypothetical protein